jgi:hypothetical protein
MELTTLNSLLPSVKLLIFLITNGCIWCSSIKFIMLISHRDTFWLILLYHIHPFVYTLAPIEDRMEAVIYLPRLVL